MVNGGFITDRENEKTGMVEEWIVEAIDKNNEATGYTEGPDRWMLEVAQEIDDRLEYDDTEGALESMKELDRLTNDHPDSIEKAMVVKDVKYPEGGQSLTGRNNLKDVLNNAEKKTGQPSASSARVDLAKGEQSLRREMDRGHGEDSSGVQQAKWRIERAKEKLESITGGSSQEPAEEEESSGGSSRCETGTHRDPKSGQCRPIN